MWAFPQDVSECCGWLSVEFPDWQSGEVEWRCDIISNCTFESSGRCNIFVLGDKGW